MSRLFAPRDALRTTEVALLLLGGMSWARRLRRHLDTTGRATLPPDPLDGLEEAPVPTRSTAAPVSPRELSR